MASNIEYVVVKEALVAERDEAAHRGWITIGLGLTPEDSTRVHLQFEPATLVEHASRFMFNLRSVRVVIDPNQWLTSQLLAAALLEISADLLAVDASNEENEQVVGLALGADHALLHLAQGDSLIDLADKCVTRAEEAWNDGNSEEFLRRFYASARNISGTIYRAVMSA